MPSVLDRVIERELRRELKDALTRFEQQLRQAGVTEENVKNRMRGAKQFVAFLYGRYLR
jgi:type VI protein secretion system component VasF